jgi:hypothetical protein
VQRRAFASVLLLISTLAACDGGGALNGAIPGTLSRNQTIIAANGNGGTSVGPANGVPALVIPAQVAGQPILPVTATPTPAPAATGTPAATTGTPTPAASTAVSGGSSGGSGGGGSGGGGSGSGSGSSTPEATPTPVPSTIGQVLVKGTVTTVAGNGTALVAGTREAAYPTYYDGIGSGATLNRPGGILYDPVAQVAYFSDTGVGLLRTLALSTRVTTRAGGRVYIPGTLNQDDGTITCETEYRANTTDGTWRTYPFDYFPSCNGGAGATFDGVGTNSRFAAPLAIARDSRGDLYVADAGTDSIRKIDISASGTWTVSTFASGLGDPNGLVADNSTYPPTLYATDSARNCIYRITQAGVGGPVTSTIYCGAFTPGFTDANGVNARFNAPTGLAIAPNGTLFVSDSNNNAIRRIDVNGEVSTLVGSGARGYADGSGANARFWLPQGLALDPGGNLFVADEQNHVIRMVSPAGTVSTVAGKAGTAGFADGAVNTALFTLPSAVSVDGFGVLYVTDAGNHRIRQIVR